MIMIWCSITLYAVGIFADETARDATIDESILTLAQDNRAEIENALRDVPATQAAGMRFLIRHMPPRDLQSLSAEFLLEHCRLAYESRESDGWAKSVPEDIFLNNVLPYFNVNERRDAWRASLRERCLPIVKDAATLTEAATAINRKFFKQVGLKYSTKRARADQSPFQSIESGLASCTGLSIVLIDACRSVGVPARFVGTPNWSDGSGNHSWVEIWDDGWHFTGAAEPTGDALDKAWFKQRASKAHRDDPSHAIYAVSFQTTPLVFPLSWNPMIRSVHGVDVTDRYTAQNQPLPAGEGIARFVARQADGERMSRPIRVLEISADESNEVFSGETKDERFDANDHVSTPLKLDTMYSVTVGDGDNAVTQDWRFESDGQLLVIQWNDEPNPKVPGVDEVSSRKAIADLKTRLASETSLTPDMTSWTPAAVSLTAEDAAEARELLAQHRKSVIARERVAEMDAKEIVVGAQRLKFDVKRFGERPQEGWSLYISLHGGGGAPPRVNDQQWQNQTKLYQPREGLYVAPRAPTDTWNLWHQSHVDDLLDRLIETLDAFEDVNLNRVYVMGYSAGGDGVYQLAPRMADRWAAAAMMAGHPNDASPLSLRNVPFTLHMGANDAAYKRNEVAEQWKSKLAQLQRDDPEGYTHFVKIHEGMGHWMNRQDAVAVEWMAEHTRRPTPNKIVWQQDDRLHGESYWLAVDDRQAKPGDRIEAEVFGDTIHLRGERKGKSNGIGEVTVRLDDRFIDLDQPIVIVAEGEELFRGMVPRTIATLANTLTRRHDPWLSFPAEVTVTMPPKFPAALVPADQVPNYTARRCEIPPVIDGVLDESAWLDAKRMGPFVDLVSGDATAHDTQAAITWDDQHLYVGFWVTEPNVDAMYTQRDDPIYFDNDVEVFIAGKDSYYEFEVNAFGTIYEAAFIWKDALKKRTGQPNRFPDEPQLNLDGVKVEDFNGVGLTTHPRGPRVAFLGYDHPGVRSAVSINGTLNDDSDVDEGWTIELAFPWSDMTWLTAAEREALPPKPGDQWRIDVFRFNKTKTPMADSANPDSGGWAVGPHRVWDSHVPEIFPVVTLED